MRRARRHVGRLADHHRDHRGGHRVEHHAERGGGATPEAAAGHVAGAARSAATSAAREGGRRAAWWAAAPRWPGRPSGVRRRGRHAAGAAACAGPCGAPRATAPGEACARGRRAKGARREPPPRHRGVGILAEGTARAWAALEARWGRLEALPLPPQTDHCSVACWTGRSALCVAPGRAGASVAGRVWRWTAASPASALGP